MDFIRPVDDRFFIKSHFDEGFDLSSIFGGVGNYGLDFNTTRFLDVVAAADGYVVGNGYNDEGYGNEIFILHKNGLITRYSNLDNYHDVYIGMRVKQYEVIGRTGQKPFHFEILDGNEIDNDSNLPIKDKIYNVYNDDCYFKKLKISSEKARYDPYTGKNSEGEKWKSQSIFVKFPKFKNQVNRDNITSRYCSTYYIWRTQQDDKVRLSHTKLEGTVHSIYEDIFPGEEYNCRCWAEIATEEEIRKYKEMYSFS